MATYEYVRNRDVEKRKPTLWKKPKDRDRDIAIVAGGAGFIGSCVVEKLLEETDYTVIVIDNFSTSNSDKVCSVYDKNPGRVGIYDADICDAYTLDKLQRVLIRNGRNAVIKEVWNFACTVSPMRYREKPFEVIDTCTTGVRNLIECLCGDETLFLHSSGAEVYGQLDVTLRETDPGKVNCFGPRACYDESKRMAETLIYEYLASGRLKQARIFRIFNTFGPGMQINDGKVIPNFILARLAGLACPIYGWGGKTRTYNYINDIVWLLMKLRMVDYNRPINVSFQNNRYTLFELCEIVNEALNPMVPDEIRCDDWMHVPVSGDPVDDPSNRVPDINLLKRLLGKTFAEYKTYNFKDGIRETAEYIMRKDYSAVMDVNVEQFKPYETPVIE